MNQLSKKKSILLGLGMFIIVVLSTIFIASPLQVNFGMVGLLLTEIMFLVLAFGGVLLTKGSFKEVFPIKKPAFRQTIGTLILWAASYLLVLFSTIVCAYFFPESFSNVSSAMTDFFTAVPFWAQFLIVAVSPAICEEAIHRGFILHQLKPIGKKWLIVLIMGILFGIFHLDPMRFLGTAILGAIITYVAIETENMFYPFLIHFVNNALSVIATELTKGAEVAAQTEEVTMTLSVVGIYMILISVSPWLLWLGIKLLHPKKENDERKKLATWKKVVLCSVTSVVCVIGGFIITVIGTADSMVVSITESKAISELAETPYTYDFEVEETKQHMLTAVLNTPEGLLEFELTDEKGSVVHEFDANQFTGNLYLDLEAGSYHLEIRYINENGDVISDSEAEVSFSVILQKL